MSFAFLCKERGAGIKDLDITIEWQTFSRSAFQANKKKVLANLMISLIWWNFLLFFKYLRRNFWTILLTKQRLTLSFKYSPPSSILSSWKSIRFSFFHLLQILKFYETSVLIFLEFNSFFSQFIYLDVYLGNSYIDGEFIGSLNIVKYS